MTQLQSINTLKPTPYFGVVGQARMGVFRSYADEMAQLVGLTDKEMAFILGMTPRNLHRLTNDQRLSIDASERLLLLKNILVHALDTFDTKSHVVLQWLRTPLSELNNQSPIQMMDTVTGFSLVNDVLGRLDYGLPA